MPVDEINRIMTHGEKWADAGGINVLNDQRELIAAALKYKIGDADFSFVHHYRLS